MADLKEEREPARVRYSVGFTKNAGDFNSIRMDISVEDSSRPGEKVADTSQRVYEFVSKELQEKLAETIADIQELEKRARKAAKK